MQVLYTKIFLCVAQKKMRPKISAIALKKFFFAPRSEKKTQLKKTKGNEFFMSSKKIFLCRGLSAQKNFFAPKNFGHRPQFFFLRRGKMSSFANFFCVHSHIYIYIYIYYLRITSPRARIPVLNTCKTARVNHIFKSPCTLHACCQSTYTQHASYIYYFRITSPRAPIHV